MSKHAVRGDVEDDFDYEDEHIERESENLEYEDLDDDEFTSELKPAPSLLPPEKLHSAPAANPSSTARRERATGLPFPHLQEAAKPYGKDTARAQAVKTDGPEQVLPERTELSKTARRAGPKSPSPRKPGLTKTLRKKAASKKPSAKKRSPLKNTAQKKRATVREKPLKLKRAPSKTLKKKQHSAAAKKKIARRARKNR